jgi:hypothetical protein
MNKLFLVLTLFTSLSVLGAVKTCGGPSPLCENLDADSFACSERWDEKVCDQFIQTFEKLLTPVACLKGQKETVLGYYSCLGRKGSADVALHFDRVARLPFQSALKLFTSPRFRSIMDGHVAETYRKKSLQDEKRLGKDLKPTSIIPECRIFETVDFKAVKKDLIEKGKVTAAQYDYREAVIGDYVIWDGDVPKKIVNSKTQHECLLDRHFIQDVTKVPGQNIVRIQSYVENGVNWDSLIELHQCKKIFEMTWGDMENHEGEVSHQMVVDGVKKSAWKKCAPCWNKDYEGCLRRL